MLTRRKLVIGSAAALALLGTLPSLLFAGNSPIARFLGISSKKQPALPAGFSKKTFHGLKHSPFYISRGSGDWARMELVDVVDGQPSPETEQFFITLRGPRTDHSSAGLFNVKHPQAGNFQLYLEPGSGDTNATSYSAAFSLLT